MNTETVMALVEAYAAECAEYEAPTISPRYADIQSAIDELLADNASLREQNTALDAKLAEPAMTEVRPNGYQFQHRQTWFGVVLMYRETVPANGYGDFEWGRWRKAKWSDMYLLKGQP